MIFRKLAKKLRLSKDLETISIWSFFKIEETKDFSFLNVDYDEFSSSNIKLEGKEYQDLWEKIYDEYCVLSKDGERDVYFKKELEISSLKIKYYLIEQLKNQYQNTIFSKEIYEELLKKWGVRINENTDENIKNINSFLSVVENMIKIKEDKVENTVTNKQKSNIYDLKLHLEKGLSKNDIDIKKTSMKYFVTMINALKDSKN